MYDIIYKISLTILSVTEKSIYFVTSVLFMPKELSEKELEKIEADQKELDEKGVDM